MQKNDRQFIWGLISMLCSLALMVCAMYYLSRSISNYGGWFLLIIAIFSNYQAFSKYIKPNL